MQVEEKPFFLEEIAIGSLLWAERHLAKSPPLSTEAQVMRRKIVDRALAAAAILATGSVGIISFGRISQWRLQQELTEKAQKLKFQHDYYGKEWQNTPDVQTAIKKAAAENLFILKSTPDNFPIYSQDNVLFYHPSNTAILSINREAFTAFLQENGKPRENIAFIISDQQTPVQDILGATNFRLKLRFESNPSAVNISYDSPQQAISILLSSTVAAIYESYKRFGPETTTQIITKPVATDPNWQQYNNDIKSYMNQFANNRSKPFIRVIAINPLWLNINQR